MIFIKFLFHKIYSFYKRFWPNNDPELYAYLATVFIITLNMVVIHFAYIYITNPDKSLGASSSLILLGINAVIGFFVLLKGGKRQKLSEDSFKLKLFKGKIGSIFAICYIISVITAMLILAYKIRQYHI